MLAPGIGVNVRGRQIPYTVDGLSVAEHTLIHSPMRYHEALIKHKGDSILAALNEQPMIRVGMSPDEGIRRLAWGGIPESMRVAVWKLLCGYDPPSATRREQEHQRKIREYSDFVSRYFDTKSMSVPQEKEIIHQLKLDLPRHKLDLFHIEEFCKPLERVLYIWSLRHPAVAYVQGMDDIIAVFFIAFLVDLFGSLGRGKNDLQRGKNQHLLKSFSCGSYNLDRKTSDSSVSCANQASYPTSEGAFDGRRASSIQRSVLCGTSTSDISYAAITAPGRTLCKHQDSLMFPIRHPMRLVCTCTPFFATSQTEKQRQFRAGAHRNDNANVSGIITDNTMNDRQPQERVVSPLESLLEKNGGPITAGMLHVLEADLYWCGGKMLSWIQDHFVQNLHGVHNIGHKVEKLLNVVDYPYASALAHEGLSIQQATFQWHHCLLARELSPALCMRLWDTYLSIGETFAEFHVYVCCSIILAMKSTILDVEDDNGIGVHHHAPPPTVCASRDRNPSSKGSCSNSVHSASSAPPVNVKIGLDVIIQLFRTPLQCLTEGSCEKSQTGSETKEDQSMNITTQMEWLDGTIAQAYLIQLRYPPTVYS